MRRLNQLVPALLGTCMLAETGVKNGIPPLNPVPSPAQLAWHDMEMHVFVHFTISTFTGKDWGAPVAEGEFSNIRASPVPQRIDLKVAMWRWLGWAWWRNKAFSFPFPAFS